MTLQEKEHALEKIGGAWAVSMRCSREALEGRLAGVMATAGTLDPFSQNEVVRQKLAHHTAQYERMLDRIIELARQEQKRMASTEYTLRLQNDD